jgi:hypothetical protein
MPQRNSNRGDQEFALLAVTAVTISKEFLGGDTVLPLFPEITVAAMYYAVNLLSCLATRSQSRATSVTPRSTQRRFCRPPSWRR